MDSRALGPILQAVRGAMAVSILLGASSALAATITVVNTQDTGPGSLRAAIGSAASGDTIDFNVPLPATITLTTPLTFGPSVSIVGPGADSLAISGGDSVVVIIVNGGAKVTISSLAIEHGSSQLGGGVLNAGTLTMTDVALHDNSLGTHSGGAIFNDGTLSLIRCTIANNGADEGGGIYNHQGNVTIDHSDFESNVATAFSGNAPDGKGGGVANEDLNGTVTVTDSTFHLNSANSAGGGIYSIGTLTVTRSTFSANGALVGGGILNDAGTLTVTSSTISGNIVGTSGPEGGGGAGIVSNGSLTVSNSTIADNISDGDAGGGGIWQIGSTANISNSTVSGNLATAEVVINGQLITAGGGILVWRGDVVLKNSIVAQNSVGGNCGTDSEGAFTSLDHNLSDDASCAPFLSDAGDLNSTAAGLDPNGLRNNGGPTETIALLPTSAAVNAVPVGACTDTSAAPVKTDQRGVLRPQGPACEIGAFEYFQSRLLIAAVQTFLLIDDVQSAPLPPGRQQGLIAPLQAAVVSLNGGDIGTATSQLGAFINQTSALVRRGTLSSDQGSALTTEAEGIITMLRSGPPGGPPSLQP